MDMLIRDQRTRRSVFAALCMCAIAFGWIESIAVVYLREVYGHLPMAPSSPWLDDFQITLVSLPGRLVSLEELREACTIAVLAGAAWAAGRRPAERAGAFLLLFGAWDLTYYVALRAIATWPDALGTWDVLFLIPAPWVAPVWAPMSVASIFVAIGTYLFWTPDRPRHYRVHDAAVLAGAVALTLAAFLFDPSAPAEHRIPEHFPAELFSTGIALGIGWFFVAEHRATVLTGRSDGASPRVL